MTDPILPSLNCTSTSHVAGETVGGLSYCQCRAIAVTNTAPPSESVMVETCAHCGRAADGGNWCYDAANGGSHRFHGSDTPCGPTTCSIGPSAPPVEPRSSTTNKIGPLNDHPLGLRLYDASTPTQRSETARDFIAAMDAEFRPWTATGKNVPQWAYKRAFEKLRERFEARR